LAPSSRCLGSLSSASSRELRVMPPPAAKGQKASPWVDLHAPRHLGEVLGHTDQVRKLAEWLRDFDDVVLHGKLKEPPPPPPEERWRTIPLKPDNINARAALVTGPPGIGKTTTCRLIARCFKKFDVMEFNASDARSKGVVDHITNSLAGNHMLKMSAGGAQPLKRTVLIMDECDGMSGGDKGGMQALINMVKVTKNPIICICNDRNNQHVRNLAAHCLEVKFKRPEPAIVSKRVKAILASHGQSLSAVALEGMIEACGADIRQVLNQVQFFGLAGACSVGSQKDVQVMLSPFDVCDRLLNQDATATLQSRIDLLHVDTELMPLMIQENYLRPFERTVNAFGEDSTKSDLSTCAYAAELISLADTFHYHADWSVQGSLLEVGSLYPAVLAARAGPQKRAFFPVWLQKRSTHLKSQRLAQELSIRLKCATTGTQRSLLTTGYHDVLYRRLCSYLAHGDTRKCAATLVRHGLARDFLAEQAGVLRLPIQLPDLYKQFDLKVKTQLLHETQSLLQMNAPIKRKRTVAEAGGGPEGLPFGDYLGEDSLPAENGEEAAGQEEDDGMVTKRKTKVVKKPVKEPSKKRDAADLEKCSLAKWCVGSKDKPSAAADGSAKENLPGQKASTSKGAAINLRYIEGHTCAVRRRVHLHELLGPWKRM